MVVSIERLLPHDTLESVLEPLERLLLADEVAGSDLGLAASTLGDALTRTGPVISCQPPVHKSRASSCNLHADVEVHAVDTDRWVVLDTQVNVLRDTETEVASLGEVALPQLVLLDLEATLQNLLSLGTTDGNVDGDLFVTTDTEGTDGVTGLAYWGSTLALVLSQVFCTANLLPVFSFHSSCLGRYVL